MRCHFTGYYVIFIVYSIIVIMSLFGGLFCILFNIWAHVWYEWLCSSVFLPLLFCNNCVLCVCVLCVVGTHGHYVLNCLVLFVPCMQLCVAFVPKTNVSLGKIKCILLICNSLSERHSPLCHCNNLPGNYLILTALIQIYQPTFNSCHHNSHHTHDFTREMTSQLIKNLPKSF